MREQGIDGWRELARRSQDDIGWFWDAVVRHLGIEFSTPYERVFDDSRGPMWTTWFGGGRINLTHNCVDRHARTTPDRIAVIAEGEDGEARTVTYAELGAMTNRLANALLARGVAAGVAARLADAGAVALITCDAVPRRGKPVAVKALADEALAAAPAVHTVIVHDRLGTEPPMQAARDLAWADAVDRQSPDLDAPDLDPETPMMVIYTSGTTGRPKGAVHVHGGFLVKIAQECAFQTDVHADDRFMWVTDMGWIMGPKEVVGTGAIGGTLVLSEGAPDYPGPDRLWQLVERHRVSVLGISPTLIRALRAHGDEPVRAHDRSSLRILASTGEPWNPDPYRWLHDV